MVAGIQVVYVERRKIVAKLQALSIQLEQSIAIVAPTFGRVETAVASGEKYIAILVCRRPCIAFPDSAVIRIGRGIEDSFLFEAVCVVSHDPAVVGANIAG